MAGRISFRRRSPVVRRRSPIRDNRRKAWDDRKKRDWKRRDNNNGPRPNKKKQWKPARPWQGRQQQHVQPQQMHPQNHQAGCNCQGTGMPQQQMMGQMQQMPQPMRVQSMQYGPMPIQVPPMQFTQPMYGTHYLGYNN